MGLCTGDGGKRFLGCSPFPIRLGRPGDGAGVKAGEGDAVMFLNRKASRRHEGVMVRQHSAFEVEEMESRICLSAGGPTGGQTPPPKPPPGSPPPPPPIGVNLKNGLLSVVGDYETANTISVTLDGSNVDVTLNGKASAFAASDVSCVLVAGGDGDDVITVDLGGATLKGPVQIHAGEGKNTVTAGAEDDVIFANPTDVVNSGAGNDKVITDGSQKQPPPPPPPVQGGGQQGQGGKTGSTSGGSTGSTTSTAKPAAKKHHRHHKSSTTTTGS